MFFVPHHCFGFQKPKLKNINFVQKRGCNIMFFFMNLCFAKCEKLSFLGFFFLANFWLFFKTRGILAHFSKNKLQKRHF